MGDRLIVVPVAGSRPDLLGPLGPDRTSDTPAVPSHPNGPNRFRRPSLDGYRIAALLDEVEVAGRSSVAVGARVTVRGKAARLPASWCISGRTEPRSSNGCVTSAAATAATPSSGPGPVRWLSAPAHPGSCRRMGGRGTCTNLEQVLIGKQPIVLALHQPARDVARPVRCRRVLSATERMPAGAARGVPSHRIFLVV
jgi:hypothetical protein